MDKLRELKDGVHYLRDYVPLNLLMLDNRHVNKTLEMLIGEIMEYITDYFKILNRNENKR